MKNFLKVGEFAELCQTTKDTMLHYARLHLLPPRHTMANGYRVYAQEQFWDYSLISLLKATGARLDAIRDCVENATPEGSIDFIRSRISGLCEEQEEIRRRIQVLNAVVALSEEALHCRYDTLIPETVPDRDFRYHPVEDKDFVNSDKYIQEYSARLNQERGKGKYRYPPLGFIIPLASVRRREYRAGYLFSDSAGQGGTKVRQAGGPCVSFFHHGDSTSHRHAFRAMLSAMREQRLEPAGDLCAYDLMNYSLGIKGDDYILKYTVRIQPPEAARDED